MSHRYPNNALRELVSTGRVKRISSTLCSKLNIPRPRSSHSEVFSNSLPYVNETLLSKWGCFVSQVTRSRRRIDSPAASISDQVGDSLGLPRDIDRLFLRFACFSRDRALACALPCASRTFGLASPEGMNANYPAVNFAHRPMGPAAPDRWLLSEEAHAQTTPRPTEEASPSQPISGHIWFEIGKVCLVTAGGVQSAF